MQGTALLQLPSHSRQPFCPYCLGVVGSHHASTLSQSPTWPLCLVNPPSFKSILDSADKLTLARTPEEGSHCPNRLCHSLRTNQQSLAGTLVLFLSGVFSTPDAPSTCQLYDSTHGASNVTLLCFIFHVEALLMSHCQRLVLMS